MGNNKTDEVKETSKKVERCRICGKDELECYVNLGKLPLANNLGDTQKEAIEKDRYSLEVLFCKNCGLNQLSEVVDPRILFSHYVYKSGVSQGYINHCKDMAKELKVKGPLVVGSSADLIIDLAQNDCSLLDEFRAEIPGIRVLGIDPAKNLCEICRQKGIPVIDEFVSINTAIQAVSIYGKAQIITATNVIAHIHNIREFVLSAKFMLAHNGLFVVECPYLVDHIEGLEYPTIYHEHLSYIGITPLKKLCDETGLKIVSVEHFDIHCGTVRVSISHDYSNREVENSVQEYLDKEEREGYNSIEKYMDWNDKVVKNYTKLYTEIMQLKSEGKRIAAFGGSAKGNTLLNVADLDHNIIDYIVDDTPEKQNKFSPGTGIPIVSREELINNPPDYLLILAWNFYSEIKSKLKDVYKGKYIVPIPTLLIED